MKGRIKPYRYGIIAARFLTIVFSFCLIGYIAARLHGLEFITNWILYGIVIALLFVLGIVLIDYLKVGQIVLAFSLCVVFVIALFLYKNRGVTEIVTLSPNKDHAFVVKNEGSGTDDYYFNNYYVFLAKAKERLPYKRTSNYQVTWLSDEACVLTYEDTNKTMRQYIGTYGGRKSSYSYITSELEGTWRSADGQYTIAYKSTGISGNPTLTMTAKNVSEEFSLDQLTQYGTTSAVLTDQKGARWALTLSPENTYSKKNELIRNRQTKLIVKESSFAADKKALTLYFQP